MLKKLENMRYLVNLYSSYNDISNIVILKSFAYLHPLTIIENPIDRYIKRI